MVRITTSKSGISGLLRNQWGNPGFSYHDFCCVYLGRLRSMCVYKCVINVYTMYKYVKKCIEYVHATLPHIYTYIHFLLEMFVLQYVFSAASTLDQSVGMLGALTFERPEWAES